MKSFHNYWLLGLLLAIASCQKIEDTDPIINCSMQGDLGEYFLKPASLSYLAIPDSVKFAVFSDINGIEYDAQISHYGPTLTSGINERDFPCEGNEAELFNFSYEVEWKIITYSFEALDLNVQLNLRVSLASTKFHARLFPGSASIFVVDLMNVYLFKAGIGGPPKGQITFVVDARNTPFSQVTQPMDQPFSIHDRSFEDVYTQGLGIDETHKLFYNKAYGLIGLESLENSLSLKFEHFRF